MRTLFALALVVQSAWASPAVFKKQSWEQARKEARSSHKWLLVDATASWCGPCKLMDRITWVDPKVVEYLGQHALAIQIDVDEQAALARELHITAMPTVILWDDQGELDRITGVRKPDELLQWLAGVESGRTSLATLRANMDENDVKKQLELADELLHRGRLEEATEHYLWFWDHPELARDQGWWPVRHTMLKRELKVLLGSSPAAREAFQKRLDAAQARLAEPLSADELEDWLTLSQLLDGGESALRACRDFPASDLEPINRQLYDLMVERQLWVEAGRYLLDPAGRAEALIKGEARVIAASAEMEAYARKSCRRQLVNLYHALRAAGREEAEELRERCLEHDPSAEMGEELQRLEVREEGQAVP